MCPVSDPAEALRQVPAGFDGDAPVFCPEGVVVDPLCFGEVFAAGEFGSLQILRIFKYILFRAAEKNTSQAYPSSIWVNNVPEESAL